VTSMSRWNVTRLPLSLTHQDAPLSFRGRYRGRISEQRHFANVIATFQNYQSYSLSANNRRRKDFFTLPRADQELLTGLGYKEKIDAVAQGYYSQCTIPGSDRRGSRNIWA
ncbi:hypothetical protein MPER_05433, partial [Moniliophthora perniciosa FA553]